MRTPIHQLRAFVIFAMLCVTPLASADVVSISGITTTSLLKLLTSPEQYDGKLVRVSGYYLGGFEQSAIYITKESAQLNDNCSSIWIDLPEYRTNTVANIGKGYVTVVGVFQAAKDTGVGHLGMWPGTLREVTHFTAARRTRALSDFFSTPIFLLGIATICLIFLIAFKRSKSKSQN